MRKILLIAALFSFAIAKAQNPVSQPQYFLTWIKVKDSARLPLNTFMGTNDTAATKAYARSLVPSYNVANWDSAYQQVITSISFSTSTGTLTLIKRNGVRLDQSLDGRYLKITDTTSLLANYVLSDGTRAGGTWNIAITGNSATATILQTSRTINGVSFNGSANITVTAAAGTLTGSTLASNVLTSSLTAVGTITTGVWQGTAIANGFLANSTISGVSLGGTLFSHTVSYGLTGSAYNGSAAVAWNVDSSKFIPFTDTSYNFGVATKTFVRAQGFGTGTVSSVSIVTANGFAGSVANASTTPAITLTTSITGVLKGNGTAISAASAGTDYMAPSSTFNLGTTSIALNRSSASQTLTGISIDGNAGTATALQTGRTINGTTFDGTGNITITAAAGTLTGSTLNSSVTASSLTSLGTLGSLTVTGTITAGSFTGTHTGTWAGFAIADAYISSASNWNTAYNKRLSSASFSTSTLTLTLADASTVTASVPTWNQNTTGNAATVTTNANLTGPVTSVGNATTISAGVVTTAMMASANISQWTNNSGYITGNQTITLSGDVTGSGTTAITTTFATVNSNVGLFGSSTAIPSFTVNAKGLITAASTSVVIAPAGTLTGSTLASGVTSSSLTSLGTITTGVWNGTAIANAYLANSTISGISLGSNLATLTFGSHITGTSYNGSTGVTIATDATSANTVSTIMARDANGDVNARFFVGSLSGSINGNAATATALQTARTIQGVSFDATANINIINGTGFVKASGTTISYDNSTYLTTSSAASTYVPWSGGTSALSIAPSSFALGSSTAVDANSLSIQAATNNYFIRFKNTSGTFIGGVYTDDAARLRFNNSTGAVFDGYIEALGGVKSTGIPSVGTGPEMTYSASIAYFQGYNRGSSAYIPTVFDGSTVTINTGGSAALSFNSSQIGTFSASQILWQGGSYGLRISSGRLNFNAGSADPSGYDFIGGYLTVRDESGSGAYTGKGFVQSNKDAAYFGTLDASQPIQLYQGGAAQATIAGSAFSINNGASQRLYRASSNYPDGSWFWDTHMDGSNNLIFGVNSTTPVVYFTSGGIVVATSFAGSVGTMASSTGGFFTGSGKMLGFNIAGTTYYVQANTAFTPN